MFLRILQDTYTTPDSLREFLEGEGYSGTLPDMMFYYLEDQGFDGALNDMLWQHENASFAISLTGLLSDTIGTYGQIGTHASIGYTILPDNGTETVKWSNSSDPADPATYGTGAAPTDFTASDDALVYLHVTDGGETVTASFTARYAPGSVTESGLADWTIDDDVLNINLATDFTTTNLTGSYIIAGLPTGAVDDGDGSISGTATGSPATTNFTCTFTDQYGRTIVGNYSVDTVYRTQATAAGALGPFGFPEDQAITAQNLAADFTLNGNTLTYAMVSALPSGLSVSAAGSMTGTPTDITASASYTVRGTDEYGRTTDSAFTLEITAASAGDWADNGDWASNNDWAGLTP